MKTFELKKESWHYKAALWWAIHIPEETNICTYARYVFFGSFLFAFIFSVISFLGGIVAYGLAATAWALITAGEIPEFAWAVLFSLSIIVSSFVGVFGYAKTKNKIKEWTHNASEKDNPGFLYLMYVKIKDKTCAKIVLK